MTFPPHPHVIEGNCGTDPVPGGNLGGNAIKPGPRKKPPAQPTPTFPSPGGPRAYRGVPRNIFEISLDEVEEMLENEVDQDERQELEEAIGY